MSKLLKFVLLGVGVLVLFLVIIIVNSNNQNREKADRVKGLYSAINIPSSLELKSAEWTAAFFPDSTDHMEYVYNFSEGSNFVCSGLKAALENAGYEVHVGDYSDCHIVADKKDGLQITAFLSTTSQSNSYSSANNNQNEAFIDAE